MKTNGRAYDSSTGREGSSLLVLDLSRNFRNGRTDLVSKSLTNLKNIQRTNNISSIHSPSSRRSSTPSALSHYVRKALSQLIRDKCSRWVTLEQTSCSLWKTTWWERSDQSPYSQVLQLFAACSFSTSQSGPFTTSILKTLPSANPSPLSV